MKQYKYTLDKSSKKFLCPKCSKKTFVKFIETEIGSYLTDEFGRCDRESNCGYYRKPETEFQKTFEVLNIPMPEPSFHSLELLEKTFLNTSSNNFVHFLETLFPNDNDKVKKAVSDYLIGTWESWRGTTIFWQIDQMERVHHGKVMLYNPNTGKRAKNKEGKGMFSTVRSLAKLGGFVLEQCLFGLHLVDINTGVIALVESEKTAVIMSIFKPEYIWLATGSKGGFKYEYLKAIKEYKITAFPDKSEYNDWLNKAIELNGFGFKITVNDWLENTDYSNGTDLADVYINEREADPATENWKPKKEHKFSKGTLEVNRIVQERNLSKRELTKEESYKAIQYFIDNNTDTYRL
jgi:frataxin-like iron-binding protein CyaY